MVDSKLSICFGNGKKVLYNMANLCLIASGGGKKVLIASNIAFSVMTTVRIYNK
jgi:ribosomal protein L30E